MAYKVLYRKYRPSTFSEIVGQDVITSTLKQSIIENKISHAYIFTGPRGTGKTSTAKVFAKTVNCENCQNGEACTKCTSCQNFSTNPDIIEIDAASNNGVDEIRELRSNVTLAPTSSKYKVYIIDEVHMLSPGAFNALLKTLEEPPAHAIFILATTEIYKVPITILSRCQRYDFKKIKKVDMVSHLRHVCETENIKFDMEGIDEIYELSDGCLRDALSILDQTSKSYPKITVDALLESYNIVSQQKIKDLIDYSIKGNSEEMIKLLEDIETSGVNTQKFIKMIIDYAERLAIDTKLKRNTNYPFRLLSALIEKLSRIYVDSRINENSFTLIKLTFLGLSDSFLNSENISSPIQKQNPQKKESEVSKTSSPNSEKMDIIAIRINNCFVEANKNSLKRISDFWINIGKDSCKGLDLENFHPVVASETYTIFTVEEDSLADLFNIKSSTIEKILNEQGFNIKVVAVTGKRWDEERQEYLNNFKAKRKYEYMDEPSQENKIEKIEKQVKDLFDDKKIEIS